MDAELRNLATHTEAEAARRFGNRLTNEFQQIVSGGTQTTAYEERWGMPSRFSRRAAQLASAGIAILLLAALTLLFSLPGGDEMAAAATATVSAVGGVSDSTVDGPKPPPTVQASPVVTVTPSITITFGCESSSCPIYQEAARGFHQLHPELMVLTVPIEEYVSSANAPATDDEKLRKLTSFVDAYVYWPLEHEAVARYVQNLTPLLEDDPDIDSADYYPQAFFPFQWDNSIWALPSNVAPTLLFYNRALFDEREMPYPALEWSQKDFFEIAKLLTRLKPDGKNQYGFVDYANALRYAISIEASKGVHTPSANLSSEIIYDYVTWYTDLALKFAIMPITPAENNENLRMGDAQSHILRGEVAMWTDYLMNYPQMAENIHSNQPLPKIGFAPLPLDSGKGLIAWFPGYFISQKTVHLQESWLWLKYLSEHRVPFYRGDEKAMAVPARRATAETSGYWGQWSAEERKVIEYVLDNPLSWPTLESAQRTVMNMVDRAIDGVFAGQSLTGSNILSPTGNETASGDVPIIGRATHESFDRYELYFKQETEGDDAYIYFGGGAEPVELGQLGVWKTGELEPGAYTLRMRVVRTTGDYAEYFVHNVQLAAGQPPSPEQLSRFAYGIVADVTGSEPAKTVYDAVRDLEFTWVKHDIHWETYQPAAAISPRFDRLRRNLTNAQGVGLNTLLTVSGSPSWAQASDTNANGDSPPVNSEQYADFLGELAHSVCPTSVKAIEVWDEQNMNYAWGDHAPNPKAYFEMLNAAHDAIKEACPSMLVISGGLTPAGQNSPQAVDELIYMDQLLTLGLTDYVDGIGVHLPGYNVPPSADVNSACDAITADKATFRGACDSPHHSWSFRTTLDEYAALLAKHSVTDKRLWVTEFGWPAGTPINSSFSYVGDNTRAEQAQWTLESLAIMAQMPEVGPTFLSNLNASVEAPDSAAAQWSILDADGAPLPVYEQLRERGE
ncbi:MAG: extracellular solute-binding protein [Caldilineaceae bacterium]